MIAWAGKALGSIEVGYRGQQHVEAAHAYGFRLVPQIPHDKLMVGTIGVLGVTGTIFSKLCTKDIGRQY